MGQPVDPSATRRPGILLLVSDERCFLCGAPKVFAEPTQGLGSLSGRPDALLSCMNAPCPCALEAKPLLDDLRAVLKALKGRAVPS